MPSEDSEGDAESGNGEEQVALSYKHKYRELKARLKYLTYEHECFESDIQKAQKKLLQLSREKSFLLDKLMRYETVIVSEDDDTDFSSDEDEGGGALFTALSQGTESLPSQSPQHTTPTPKQPLPLAATATAMPLAPKQTPVATSGGVAAIATKTIAGGSGKGGLKKPGKTTVVVSRSVASGAAAGAGGGGGGGGVGTGKKISASAAAKISKTVARQHPTLLTTSSVSAAPLASQQPCSSPLVVSLPLNPAGLPLVIKPPLQPSVSMQVEPTLAHKPLSALAPQPNELRPIEVAHKVDKTSSSSSSAGSSSSSSSSSDSDDSSDSNSSSEVEEAMDTMPQGPVPMVTTIGNGKAVSGQLLKPKAITSPVKAPPQLISSSTPPALLSPLTSPSGQIATFSWTNRPRDSSAPSSSSGFVPIAPPLSSPPSSLPFSQHSSGSAFHIVSPKIPPLVPDSNKKPPT